MNSKLSISDIAGLVSKKCGLTKRECESFLKELFQLAAETLSSGEQLTIKGIGLFRLVWVEQRGSVDINTGTSITIPGHYKLSYQPDKALRDAVNEPFAYFSTEILPSKGDSTAVSDEVGETVRVEHAEENVSRPVPEITAMHDNREALEEKKYDIASVAAVDEETGQDESVREPETQPSVSEENMQKGPDVNYPQESEAVETGRQESPVAGQADDIEKEYRRRTRKGYIAGFVTAVILFLLIGGGAYYFYSSSRNFDITLSIFKIPAVNTQTEKDKANKPGDETVLSDETAVEKIDTVSKRQKSGIAPGAEAGDGEVVVETIEPGKFLTTIAREYYGNKIFWVYIYRENEDRIWNPRYLPKGFKVVVPPPSKYSIDSEDEASIKRAQELEKQILYEIE